MGRNAEKSTRASRLAARRKAIDGKKGKPQAVEADVTPSERSCKLPEKLIGLKYVRLLEKQVEQLRAETVEHGNRKLFLDDVFIVYLLAFFNPCIRSLRTLEDLSQLPKVQDHLSISKVCKSTLSDFNQLVDPERLEPILTALRAQLSRKRVGQPSHDRDLQSLLKHTVAVDGTFLPAVAEVMWAIANGNSHGTTRHRARIDGRVNVSTWLPEAMVIPDAGESESDSAIRHIEEGKIYLYDRGYTGFALLRAHFTATEGSDELAMKSHFVVRYKKAGGNSPTLNGAVEQPMTDEDRVAGVISDRVGYFTSEGARQAGVSAIQLREVIVIYEDAGEKKTLRLITSLLNVSARTIALLYQQRWQVELFFRWFKSFGNFGHLISQSREGALSHLYVTIIGMLLMYLHTGYRPSKYMFALLGQVAAGGATLADVLPILRERERRKELDRASAARRRAEKMATGH